MIRDVQRLREFEKSLARQDSSTLLERLEIFERLLEQARSLGVFPPADPLSGIELDIEIARTVNGL